AARKREEELRLAVTRLEGQSASAQAAAAQAAEEAEKLGKELATQNAARARKLQELESALETAIAARGRAERELAQRTAALEGRTSDLEQRLRQALADKRELEARGPRQVEELSVRHRAELERREQQRATEVSRLQLALQEKTK